MKTQHCILELTLGLYSDIFWLCTPESQNLIFRQVVHFDMLSHNCCNNIIFLNCGHSSKPIKNHCFKEGKFFLPWVHLSDKGRYERFKPIFPLHAIYKFDWLLLTIIWQFANVKRHTYIHYWMKMSWNLLLKKKREARSVMTYFSLFCCYFFAISIQSWHHSNQL